MEKILVLGFLFLVVAYFVILKPWLQTRRRARISVLPFPEVWKQILNEHFPLYSRLPVKLKNDLEGKIQIFLDEKQFSGKKGLEITDTMRVLIAAQACMLILNRPSHFFPKLTTILVYPSTFFSMQQQREGDLIVEKNVFRSGESWVSGPLVLAWDASKRGAKNPFDGQNVVMHEFAHQLDQEDNRSDGVPDLREPSLYSTWPSALGKEYHVLIEQTRKRNRTVLNKYGATNPAEFFAVATETFFEKPKQLSTKHRELYDILCEFYKLDPLEWES